MRPILVKYEFQYFTCKYISLTTPVVIDKFTVKPALVTTYIKQTLVLCDLAFYYPTQYIPYQLNLY